jgi:glycosyltransferase involved in cell wall biosynthesis
MLSKGNSQEVLSICIPTRNRPEKLKLTVSTFLRQIKSLNVKIYISDNSDDESTMQLLAENFSSHNESLVYFKNEDKYKTFQSNFLNLVYRSKGQYLWFFGDDDLPYDYALDKIFSRLDESPDFIEVKYVGYDEKLEMVLPYWNGTIENDARIDKDHFIDELISTIPFNGFISFMIMKRNYILDSINNKLMNLKSNYIQTYIWAIALISMPQSSFGYSIGVPLVKWREDFGNRRSNSGWSKSRFLLALEHREIYVLLSRECEMPSILNKYDGTFQYKLISMAFDWRLKHHMSLLDSLLANRYSQKFYLSTKISFILIGISPLFFLASIKRVLSPLYNRILNQ